MKVYFYTDNEVGVKWPGPDHDFLGPDGKPREPAPVWPRFVWYDWPNSTVVDDPTQADVFVMRQRLIWVDTERIYTLPHMNAHRKRHVFFDLGPDSDPRAFRPFSGLESLIISATITKSMRRENPRMMSWCWPVEDLTEWTFPTDFDADFVFQGQTTLESCKRAIASVQGSQLRARIQVNTGFYGQMEPSPTRKEIRRTYIEGLRKSRLSLCAASIPGVIRYRFYEAMAMGRCVAFIGDECELPLQDRIDYSVFVVVVPEQFADRTGSIVENWLEHKTDVEIIERGAYAQEAWKCWFKREIWNRSIGTLVEEGL